MKVGSEANNGISREMLIRGDRKTMSIFRARLRKLATRRLWDEWDRFLDSLEPVARYWLASETCGEYTELLHLGEVVFFIEVGVDGAVSVTGLRWDTRLSRIGVQLKHYLLEHCFKEIKRQATSHTSNARLSHTASAGQ